ncbi:SIS domain-containing protein [Hutsoniella sourekii]
MDKFIEDYLKEFKNTLNLVSSEQIKCLHDIILKYRDNDKTIFLLGNGGSSASCSHWVCDFNKGASVEGASRIKMICLSDNIPIFSALGNDLSYDLVFSEQLKNLLKKDDLVIGLTVSGNSKNLIEAFKYAQSISAQTFSIVGDFNGALLEYSDWKIVVPSKNYGIVEDTHMYLCHLISQYIKQNILD